MKKCILLLLLLASALSCLVWAADAPVTPATPTPLPKTKINPKDGAEMVLIPAGKFQMGTSEIELSAWLKTNPDYTRESFTGELPQHKVEIDVYYIYKTEVTVAQYRKFCAATGREMPPEPEWKYQDTHPIVNVTWDDANAYAQWASAALPTEAQWEKAARGGDQRIFPWGDVWPPPGDFFPDPPNMAGNFGIITNNTKSGNYIISTVKYNDGCTYTAPVGCFKANPYGIHDLAGNVWEWCADWYDAGYYKTAPTQNPTGPATGTARVLRGGSWDRDYPGVFRAANRGNRHPTSRDSGVGFRCVVRCQDRSFPLTL
jgi:sulfatase modifying factor 1